MFKSKVFSESGSISLTKEQSTYVHLRSFLDEVEGDLKLKHKKILIIDYIHLGGTLEVTMGDVLSFFTGADTIPPLGFSDAMLNFNDINPYPTASTCSLCLTLPTQYHADYNGFKENILFALCSHGGFGLY